MGSNPNQSVHIRNDPSVGGASFRFRGTLGLFGSTGFRTRFGGAPGGAGATAAGGGVGKVGCCTNGSGMIGAAESKNELKSGMSPMMGQQEGNELLHGNQSSLDQLNRKPARTRQRRPSPPHSPTVSQQRNSVLSDLVSVYSSLLVGTVFTCGRHSLSATLLRIICF